MKFTLRKIVSIAMFILFVALAISFNNSLKRYYNVITVSVAEHEELIKLKRLISSDVKYYSVIERYNEIPLQRGDFLSSSISIYKCENSLINIVPLNILYGEFDVKDNSIVISTELAFRYFSYSDCVGQKLILGNTEYVVTGVYKPSALNFITAKEEYAVYASYVSATKHNNVFEVAIKCADKYAPIIINRLGVLNTVKSVNIDSMAAFYIEPNFIPSDLSNLSEIIVKAKQFFIEANNRTFINGMFYLDVRVRMHTVLICFSLSLLIFFIELKSYLLFCFRWLLKRIIYYVALMRKKKI